jgi:hypothetical protein
MRYCHYCHRITNGEPLYCNFCGRSYAVKLCPRQHPNPRVAEACSACGSRELSTPQPKVPLTLKPFIALLEHLPGFLVVVAVVAVLIYCVLWLQEPQNQAWLLCMVLRLGLWCLVLFILWSLLPKFLRSLIKGLVTNRERSHERR